jgi:hypothetical protein
MHTKARPFVIIRNEFLSEQEAKLAEFCKKNNIKFDVIKDQSIRGQHTYKVEFEPKYLDGTEKRVVEYCKEHNIPYRFAVDNNGIHHYEFDKMITLTDENPDKIINKDYIASLSMPDFSRRSYKSEVKFVECDEDIKQLRASVDPKTVMPKKWYLKLLYYVYPPYFLKIRKKKKALVQKAIDIEDRIKQIEVEKKLMRDMLVLAGIME